MPTYEYICKDCGERFDHFQSMSSPPLSRHEGCERKGSNVQRIVSGGSGLIFKGSGFYLTDYKNNKTKEESKKSKESKDKVQKKTTKEKNTKSTGEKVS
ncbi:MAG: FmdB family transcriptional regulator [Candidatus Marinimicrobia bacterium]|nr:FmdB family transcriptional regulator [Candidatus Neomarinimicrobiota bacterium]|tara:strand:+ start:2437 stop:2733 length:297 start_codon:yes stop_codon:yes gene_type:complete